MTPEEMSAAYSRLLLENTQLRYLVRESNRQLDLERSSRVNKAGWVAELQTQMDQAVSSAKAAMNRRGPDWVKYNRTADALSIVVSLLERTTSDLNDYIDGYYADALTEAEARLEAARDLLKEST